MMCEKTSYKKVVLFLNFILLTFAIINGKELIEETEDSKTEITQENFPIISKIIVSGNKYVKAEAILHRLPYKIDEEFDKSKSGNAINNLYGLGCFRQITLEIEKEDENHIILYVIVEEKKLLENIEFHGNKTIKSGKIKDELNLKKLPTIDEETLQRISIAIKKMYAKENYHKTKISFKIILNKQNPDKATAVFDIQEGPSSAICRVFFKGNDHIEDRKLRTIIASRENWILSFMDEAGKYEEDALEMDKHRIEYFYKDNGYMMATVADTKVEFSKNDKEISITFFIKEGDKFTTNKIDIIGDKLFDKKDLLHCVILEEKQPYSQSKLIESINNLKSLWGEKGYIYADVYPQMKLDEEKKEVDIIFHVERGKKLYVNRINITGNTTTRDKVIRRQLDLLEGDLITSRKLAQSKANVEYLSFFEKEGINWKIHRISDEPTGGFS